MVKPARYNEIWGRWGAGRCHKHTHTAHPRRNKLRSSVERKKKKRELKKKKISVVTVHRTNQEEKFLLVCLKQQPLSSVFSSADPWIAWGRWWGGRIKGGRWSSAFAKRTRNDIWVESLQEGNGKWSHLHTNEDSRRACQFFFLLKFALELQHDVWPDTADTPPPSQPEERGWWWEMCG